MKISKQYTKTQQNHNATQEQSKKKSFSLKLYNMGKMIIFLLGHNHLLSCNHHTCITHLYNRNNHHAKGGLKVRGAR